ncbi:MAG: alpha-amylase/alpha-mannosidase [Planctomycetota bacterium]|jgi:alpha-amylase/alpha-mannosidase (GH57 family)
MIHLAFLWHMHQPYYRDMASRESALPWVRLHGTKDYYGMAALLRDRPPVKATVNWVPSLIEQLRDAGSGALLDRALRVARKPADALEEEDVLYMLGAFFRANRERMIHPYRRYRELLDLRGDDPSRIPQRMKAFTAQDLLDLQVWANLPWFHPILMRDDPVVSALIRKGSHFTEGEKASLLDRGLEILNGVIDLYRAMAVTGQIEVTTSPYFHPILPLLVNMESSRMAMPGAPLPDRRGPYLADAVRQVERAVSTHTEVFGAPPRGMWPSEGAVSAEIVPLVAEAGIRWLATDEAILGRSLGIDLARDAAEQLIKPHLLYQPYRFSEGGAEVRFVFRDRYLSDLFGFKYQHMGPRQAVGDFLDRLRRIAEANPGRDLLVCVILDGENAWESYTDGGAEFLGLLYNRLTEEEAIRTTTVSEYLETHPPAHELGRLHAGSWIDANFSVWIGSREENRAWDALGTTHDFLDRVEEEVDPEKVERARTSLLAAEGSDWFWWYGDRFSSEEDEDFDALFRTHLANVYRFLDRETPEALLRPLLATRRRIFTEPVSFLDIRLDGVNTHFFEWSGAGAYDPRRDYTAMGPGRDPAVAAVLFGFDPTTFYLRADFQESARAFFERGGDLRIPFPTRRRLAVLRRGRDPGRGDVVLAGGEEAPPTSGRWAAGKILEISIPFEKIGVHSGERLRFQVEAVRRGRVLDRFPRGGAFEVVIPGPDFEMENWFV